MVRRVDRPVSNDLVAFTRREQMVRLGRFLASRVGAKSGGAAIVPATISGSQVPNVKPSRGET
jgi:hypothetical protein